MSSCFLSPGDKISPDLFKAGHTTMTLSPESIDLPGGHQGLLVEYPLSVSTLPFNPSLFNGIGKGCTYYTTMERGKLQCYTCGCSRWFLQRCPAVRSTSFVIGNFHLPVLVTDSIARIAELYVILGL
ncbi:hypothetical protein BJX70DRAFT_359555 [Aspergillus crustosus]